jgi:hypothetical protein
MISPNQGVAGANNDLLSVSCFSITLCKAVGYATASAVCGTDSCSTQTNCPTDPLNHCEAMALDYNGTSWALETTVYQHPGYNNYLTGVSCGALTLCMAVGYYCSPGICAVPNNNQTLAVSCTACTGGPGPYTWNDTAPQNATGSNQLNAVDCASATSCLAAGYSTAGGRDSAAIQIWQGGWKIMPADPVCSGGLNAHLWAVSQASNFGNGIAVGDCDNGGPSFIPQNFAETGGNVSTSGGVTLVG